MFGVAEGGSGVVPSPGGDGRIIFKVAEVFEPAGAGPDAVPEDARKSFASGPFRRSARPAGGAAAGRIRGDHRPERDPAGAGFLTAMSELKAHIAKVASGKPLTFDEARSAFDTIMSGEATPSQIGAFLMALRVRGETVDEISGAVATMREKMLRVEAPDGAIDIVGTGGDGSHSVNISTASAFVIAGAGVPVAKHGNRGLSSQTGAADVLTALGVKIDIAPEAIGHCIRTAGVGFMFAPAHHPAMRHVGPTRARDRHAHDLQPAGAALQPGRRQAADGRRVRARMGRAAGPDAEGAGHRAGLGGARRRLRRDHHDRRDARVRTRQRRGQELYDHAGIDRAAAATGARNCAAATRLSTRARCAICSKARPAPIATPC